MEQRTLPPGRTPASNATIRAFLTTILAITCLAICGGCTNEAEYAVGTPIPVSTYTCTITGSEIGRVKEGRMLTVFYRINGFEPGSKKDVRIDVFLHAIKVLRFTIIDQKGRKYHSVALPLELYEAAMAEGQGNTYWADIMRMRYNARIVRNQMPDRWAVPVVVKDDAHDFRLKIKNPSPSKGQAHTAIVNLGAYP